MRLGLAASAGQARLLLLRRSYLKKKIFFVISGVVLDAGACVELLGKMNGDELSRLTLIGVLLLKSNTHNSNINICFQERAYTADSNTFESIKALMCVTSHRGMNTI